MLGLSLVPILDNDRDLSLIHDKLMQSNVNHYIVRDPIFDRIVSQSRGSSGMKIIEEYNNTLLEDASLFSNIPFETLQEIIFSVREASTLYRMSRASKRITVFLSEPYMMSIIREKYFPDRRVQQAQGTTKNDFPTWYFKTFFTEACIKYNEESPCVYTALINKNFRYLIRHTLVPSYSVLMKVINHGNYFVEIDTEEYIEYVNFLYYLGQGQIGNRKRQTNNIANTLVIRYITYLINKNIPINLEDIFQDKKYEKEFMSSWYVWRYRTQMDAGLPGNITNEMNRIWVTSEFYNPELRQPMTPVQLSKL